MICDPIAGFTFLCCLVFLFALSFLVALYQPRDVEFYFVVTVGFGVPPFLVFPWEGGGWSSSAVVSLHWVNFFSRFPLILVPHFLCTPPLPPLPRRLQGDCNVSELILQYCVGEVCYPGEIRFGDVFIPFPLPEPSVFGCIVFVF